MRRAADLHAVAGSSAAAGATAMQPLEPTVRSSAERVQTFLKRLAVFGHNAAFPAAEGTDTVHEQRDRSTPPDLTTAVRDCRSALIGIAIESGLVNLLMLSGPLFMLQVYDRVLPSGSIPTLVGLFTLVATLYAAQGMLDAMRTRLLARTGRVLDEKLAPRVFGSIIHTALRENGGADAIQASRDLDAIRSFVSSGGFTAFFDLPWIPLYIGVCFLFHPLMGVAVLVGAVLICGLALIAELLTRRPARELVTLASSRRVIAEATRRNAELIHALGMRRAMAQRWSRENDAYLDRQESVADLAGGFGGLSRTFRAFLQSAVLAIGAYLVIRQQATAGVMLAATVLSICALAPVDLAIANWKAFITARQSWINLANVLAGTPHRSAPVSLPLPASELRCTGVSVAAPESETLLLHDVSFTLQAGRALGVIGPSGSGKSSLARVLVGAWAPARGVIRLDGSTLDRWDSDVLGRSIGFLPQDVELLAGTVADNIARFAFHADPDALLAAAQAAAVLDLIRVLPNGFDTQVGEGGTLLSGGQRQRIALARALYGNPFLVVLDEPNSNLDAQGEAALMQAIARIRARGGAVVVITHRPTVLAAVDDILVLNGGRVQAYGPRDAILGAKPAPRGSDPTPSPPARHAPPNADATLNGARKISPQPGVRTEPADRHGNGRSRHDAPA